MDVLINTAKLGTETVIMATYDYGTEELVKRAETIYNNPKSRKRIFRKCVEVIFEGTKVKLGYSKEESISRVKRFASELLLAVESEPI